MDTCEIGSSVGQGRGAALMLAVDDVSLPLRESLCYYLSTPTVRREPVLTPSRDNPAAPDHVATHFYGTVLRDEGRFRMWYYACHWGEQAHEQAFCGNLVEGPICYAESDDGISWNKPALGQVALGGRKDNNAIALPDAMTEGAFVIKDADDPDPRRRYKMVYEASSRGGTIRTATSPDGLQWTAGPEDPIGPTLLEPSSFYRFNGLYIVNGQCLGRSEGGHPQGRTGYAYVSPDFDRWPHERCESFALAEPADPAARGGDKPYDQVHLGVGAASLGNAMVGLYCIWHNKPYPTEKDWFGMGTTVGDLGLVVSNDGLHFREPVKGHVFLRHDESPVTPIPNARYQTILCQANGILNVGDETRIYHGRWANAEHIRDYYAEVALATLPRDRWGALGLFPDAATGSVWSMPVALPPKGLDVALNADGTAGMRVEIADARFVPLPRFSGDHAGVPAAPGGLACAVAWPGASLAELGGRTVRFRVGFSRRDAAQPRLFAMYLRE